MNRVTKCIALGALATLIEMEPIVAAQILNGGFEVPDLTPSGFQTIGVGGEPAGLGWTVESGTVDVATLPVSPFILYSAFEGQQGLDLNGVGPGEIFQDFATVPGQNYALSFAYSGNPLEGGGQSANVSLTDVGLDTLLLTSEVSHVTATNNPPDADWMLFSNDFIAQGTSTRLAFASTNAFQGGIVLDAIAVDVIPAPATSSILAVALCGLERTTQHPSTHRAGVTESGMAA